MNDLPDPRYIYFDGAMTQYEREEWHNKRRRNKNLWKYSHATDETVEDCKRIVHVLLKEGEMTITQARKKAGLKVKDTTKITTTITTRYPFVYQDNGKLGINEFIYERTKER